MNHIIGFSELILEDFADRPTSPEYRMASALHAIGKDLLAFTNEALGGLNGTHSIAAPDIIAELRIGVQRHVDRMFAEGLHPTHNRDLQRICNAAKELAEFARTGEIVDKTGQNS